MNHYQTLGVKRNATQEQIKDAYKALIKKYHPDVYPGDKTFAEKKTKEFNLAYDILSNPTLKEEYDETLKEKESTTYNYTPPSYTPPSYTSSNYNTKTSKYSYDNYKRNNPPYGEYDYQKRYSDFHRTKVPNSNYENGPLEEDVFTHKISKILNNLLKPNIILKILAILTLYLVILITSFVQMNNVLKKEPTFNNSNSPSNSDMENLIIDDNLYTYNFDNFKREDFNLEDYVSFSELYNIYTQDYSDQYETYDDFKKDLEDFIFENYIKSYFTNN